MNKQANPKQVFEWTEASVSDGQPVAGYDDWLAAEIAACLAEIPEGKTTPLANVRKEFGLE